MPYKLPEGESKEVAYFVDLEQTIEEALAGKGLSVEADRKHLKYLLQCDVKTAGSWIDDKAQVEVEIERD